LGEFEENKKRRKALFVFGCERESGKVPNENHFASWTGAGSAGFGLINSYAHGET
jgi:hypothetical protein